MVQRSQYGQLRHGVGVIVATLLALLLASCGQAPTGQQPAAAEPAATNPAATAEQPAAEAVATADDAAASTAPATAAAEQPTSSTRLKVIATTSVIGDMVANVGGDKVVVTTLLSPGSDPHTYAPTPADARALGESQLVFANGVGLEEWLSELITNAGGQRPLVNVTDGLSVLKGGEQLHESEAGSEGTASAKGAAQDQAAGDPHMWFDVERAIHYVERIRDGLSSADPANAPAYSANAAAYSARLQDLDTWITQQVDQIPAERRKLIMNHDTFQYFARRYGFEVVGTIFEGISTEQEPSAQQMADLIDKIKAAGVPAVFTENTINSRLAEQVADEAGVDVVTQLYTDSLGPAGSDGDTYETMMRFNVQTIVAALR